MRTHEPSPVDVTRLWAVRLSQAIGGPFSGRFAHRSVKTTKGALSSPLVSALEEGPRHSTAEGIRTRAR